MLQYLKHFVAWSFILFGFIMTVGGVLNVLEPENEGRGAISYVAFTILLGLIPMGAGIFFLIWSGKKQALQKSNQYELDVMRFLQQSGKEVSVTEVALALNRPVEEVTQRLNDMQVRGLVDIHVSERGQLLYSMHGLLPLY